MGTAENVAKLQKLRENHTKGKDRGCLKQKQASNPSVHIPCSLSSTSNVVKLYTLREKNPKQNRAKTPRANTVTPIRSASRERLNVLAFILVSFFSFPHHTPLNTKRRLQNEQYGHISTSY